MLISKIARKSALYRTEKLRLPSITYSWSELSIETYFWRQFFLTCWKNPSKNILKKDEAIAVGITKHCIKYARMWLFIDHVLPYKNKIVDYVPVRENTPQWEPAFSRTLCCKRFMTKYYLFKNFLVQSVIIIVYYVLS